MIINGTVDWTPPRKIQKVDQEDALGDGRRRPAGGSNPTTEDTLDADRSDVAQGDDTPVRQQRSGAQALTEMLAPRLEALIDTAEAEARERGFPFARETFIRGLERKIEVYGNAIDRVAGGNPRSIAEAASAVGGLEVVFARADLQTTSGKPLRGLAFDGGIALNKSLEQSPADLKATLVEELAERFFQVSFTEPSTLDFGAIVADRVFATSAAASRTVDDTVYVEINGEVVEGEASAKITQWRLSPGARDSALKHIFRGDGHFSDGDRNGKISAAEIEIAFSNIFIPSYSKHFTTRGPINISPKVSEQIEKLVNAFGEINPETGFMTVEYPDLQDMFAAGYIGLESSSNEPRLTILTPPPTKAGLDAVSNLSIESAYALARDNMTTAEVSDITKEYGATGLLAYIGSALGIDLEPAELERIANAFAKGEDVSVISRYALPIVRTAAMAFSAVWMGNAGYERGVEIFRTAVRSQMGLNHTDPDIGAHQEYLYVGDSDGPTPDSEFLRSFLSVGRTIIAEEDPAKSKALDEGTYEPGKFFEAPAMIPTYYKDGSRLHPNNKVAPYNADGTLSGDAFNFEHDRMVNLTWRNEDPNSDRFGWLELPEGLTPELQVHMKLEAVMISTTKPGYRQGGEVIKKVDYATSGENADQINQLIADGYRMEYVKVNDASEAVKTTRVATGALRKSYDGWDYDYNANGTLATGTVASRIAQFYHDTEFSHIGLEKDESDDPVEYVTKIARTPKNLSDKDAIRLMLNELGLTDADIDKLSAKAEEIAKGAEEFTGEDTVEDIASDIATDILTMGIAPLLIEVLPGTGHPIIDFAKAKLEAAGRSTGQADEMGDEYTGGGIDDPGAFALGIAFLVLDLTGAGIVSGMAKAGGRVARYGKQFLKVSDPVRDAARPKFTAGDAAVGSATTVTEEGLREGASYIVGAAVPAKEDEDEDEDDSSDVEDASGTAAGTGFGVLQSLSGG